MNLKFKLHEHSVFLVVRQKMLSVGKFLYLIIVFTKRKVGTYTNSNAHKRQCSPVVS